MSRVGSIASNVDHFTFCALVQPLSASGAILLWCKLNPMIGYLAMALLGSRSHGGFQVDETEVRRATRAAAAAEQKFDADPDRPTFHYRAPGGWMNDPNGPILYKGWYHVFYQYNPFGDHSEAMHWGHTRSRDLGDWQDLPVALAPTPGKNETGIWSGSCHRVRGGVKAFYTSVGDGRPSVQCSATSGGDALATWSKSPDNPVLTSTLQEWRDPFLFDWKGLTYLITGGGEGGRGIVALYQATDETLSHWKPRGILFRDPDEDVANIECPNFAQVDGKWVLLISVHGRVEYFVGDMTSGPSFQTESRGVLAEGSYASQLLLDRDGRPIHLAWVPTNDHVGWNGFLTLPSRLSVAADGALLRTPLESLKKLRKSGFEVRDVPLSGEMDLSNHGMGDCAELEAEIEFGTAKEVSFRFRRSADGTRSESVQYPAKEPVLRVHLYLDRGVMDEYRDGGRSTSVRRFKAQLSDIGFSIVATGGTAHVRWLRVHSLRGARFDESMLK